MDTVSIKSSYMHHAGRFLLVLFTTVFWQADAFTQTDSSGYFASFDQVKIWYQVKGKGRPVLLIHGFTGNGSNWKTKPIYDSLIAHGFKVIIADLRGNGSSDKP